MKVVTQEDIKRINHLFLELKTYASVSRATGFSPATVKKYVDPNFTEIDESKIKRYNEPLPEFDPTMFRKNDWGELCELSNSEIAEIKELWGEMEV